MAQAPDNKLQCVVVTPETTVLDQAVDFVAVPLFDGEFGVLPGRSPVVARLGYGELRTRSGDATARYYVDGGFLQVRRNVVTVLTPRAISGDQIDTAAAEKDLTSAGAQVPTTAESFEAKTISLTRARAQIRIAKAMGK